MPIQIKKVLLPCDFSDCAAAAIPYASEIAAKFKAELHLLHTLETHVSGTPQFVMGLALPRLVHESKPAAEKALAALLEPGRSAGLQVVYAAREGTPEAEIVSYAHDNQIDLIVLATHGRTGLSHIAMGSVAETIVRTAPCPVLTIRPESHRFITP